VTGRLACTARKVILDAKGHGETLAYWLGPAADHIGPPLAAIPS
jgi:hypothetical protein